MDNEYDDYFNSQRQQAVNSVVAPSDDDDPERAARAIQLGQATGVPPEAIYPNLEEFETQHKAVLNSDVITKNPRLQSYLNSDPMASKVSQDDIGHLDTISDLLKKFGYEGEDDSSSWLKSNSIQQGFQRGFGDEPLGQMFVKGSFNRDPNPIMDAWYQLSEGTARAEGIAAEVPLRLFNGVAFALTEGALGEEAGDKLAQMMMDPGLQATLSGIGPHGALAASALAGWGRLSGYIRAGKMPPTGVHPAIDTIYKQAAESDAKALDELVKESAANATRERSPDYYSKFVDHAAPSGPTIKVDASAISRLYGDKPPEADDNILGWVPNLAERLDTTAGSGGYIEIPLKDWLAHIDPEVHKELRDDLLLRDHGFTVNEAKEVPDWKPETVEAPKEGEAATEPAQPPPLPPDPSRTLPGPTQVVRGAGGLEPLFSVGDRKITLRPMESLEAEYNKASGREPFHDFDLHDQDGRKVGSLNLSEQKGGKQLYVEMIQAGADKRMYDPNFLGPALVRDIGRQLKALFPNAFGPEGLGITGHRVSGAREKAGSYMQPSASPVVKFEHGDSESIQKFRDLLSDHWEDQGQGVEALFSTKGKGLAANSPMGQMVLEELQRIAPQAESDIAHGIADSRYGSARGMYIPNMKSIIVSLESPDPIATARHEAIHSLRDMRLFSEDEWRTLESAVLENKWFEKFNVAEKWHAASREVQIEEAVAEGYRDWRAGNEAPPEVHGIFEKIKKFFGDLAKRVGEHLGLRSDSWDEIFQKVDSGEVGSRTAEDFAESEEARAQTKAANDINANRQGKTYNAALNNQQIERLLNKDTERGDTEYWRKIAEQEGHNVFDRPNGIAAARAHSEGGKTTLHIRSDGRRSVFQDGVKVLMDRRADFDPRAEPTDSPAPIHVSLPFGEGKAIGLRQDIYQRYMRLIRQKHETDLKSDFGDALAKEKRTQTKEWREAASAIRDQVASSVDERPNILVDRLLSERAGEFKIDPMSLREDLREVLPKEYMRKTNSMSADNLAGHFGYPSGDALVEHLAQITEDRKASGLSHSDYVKKLVNDETNRQMEAQFGFLEKNILEEAKDRALSDNQISIIEQEVLALAEQAKQSAPIDRGAILSKLRESFADTPVGGISSDMFLKASGKAGRETEEALLKADYQEAFKAKQRQWLAVTQAKWAHAYEKQRKQLDRTAKRLGKKEVETIDPEYLNHTQDLLRRVGYTGKRSLDNIQENIERRGDKTLQQFVEEKLAESGGYRDIPLAEFLQDPTFKEDLDKLTHQQFSDLKATVDALMLHGRNEAKIFAEGEAADKKAVLGEMKGQLETFGKKDIQHGWEPGIGRQYIAGTTSIETLMNRWDRNDARGIFHKYVVYPLARASNGKSKLEREMSGPYRELGDPKDLKKLVESPLDPEIWKYSNFTRENVLGLIQNAGNRSNWKVAATGWGADPDVLFKWLMENSRPEDWQRAQKMGDTIFNKLIGHADDVYEHLNGHTVDKIPLSPLELEFPGGEKLSLKGWYHPLIPDPMWRGKQKLRGGAYEDGDHNHIATSNGYTRSRTGAVYPVDLGFNKIPKLMQQMIHDINFREPVLEVQKIFRDPKFQNNVTEFYGKEYSDLLMPYLKNVSGQEAIPSKLWAQIGNVSEYLRQNTIGTYIGFNPYTVMKHAPTAAVMSVADVGPAKMLWAYKNLWRETSPDGRTWWDFAIAHSEELQRRDRNWQEATASVQREQYSKNPVLAGEQKFRDKVLQWGSWPVALSDKMSAVPLWVARFDKAMDEGSDFGEAVSIADRSVRRQHGSTAVTNQPLLVQGGGPLHGWLTSVYGFFGTVMQRRLEIAHQLNDTYKLGREGEIKEAMKGVPELFKNFLAYVVVPTAIEEYVTGLSTEDREGYGSHLAKASIRGLASSFLYFRDLAYAVTTSHDPSVGLLSSPMHDMANAARDVKKGKEAINRQHAGKTVSDFITTFGELRGYAPKEAANIARFGLDYANRQAHPKEVTDWLRGLTRGTEKKRVEQ